MIHQYKNNGYNIIMDVASGSVHVVDDIVYDAVALLASEVGELEKPQKLPEKLCEQVRRQLESTQVSRAGGYSFEETGEALEEIQERFGIKAAAIVTMKEVVEHLYNRPYNGQIYIDDAARAAIDEYYKVYGAGWAVQA